MRDRVAVSMICGDTWREEEIKRLLESLEPHVDGLFISYNGENEGLDWQDWTNIPVTVGIRGWTDDFADVRNHSLSLIPKDDFDWWMWVDEDDIFHAPIGLQPIFDSLEPGTHGILLKYDYAVDPATNIVVVSQRRERIMSTKWQWRWEFPIHEIALAPSHTVSVYREEAWVEHLRKSGEDRGARIRNRRILTEAINKDPVEPRYRFYLGNEILAQADTTPAGPTKTREIDQAIRVFRDFMNLKQDKNSEDVYVAACRIGMLLAMKEDWNAAIDGYLQAIKHSPLISDAYIMIAQVLMELKDWDRMRKFADMAIRLGKPDTTTAREPLNDGFKPYLLRGIADQELGHLDAAIKNYEMAKTFFAPESLDQRIEECKKLKGHKSEEGTRQRLYGTSRERSICFFTNPSIEEWNPYTLAEGGHGGSETMVIEMARRFSADGWRTVVFGTPGYRDGLIDGVEYWNSGDFDPSEGYTVFVGSRAPNMFASNTIQADVKLLWMHDVNNGAQTATVIDRPDRVIALTEWHKNHLVNLYGVDPSRVTVIPNGFDETMYPEPELDDCGYPKFFWGSSFDRGMEQLLGLWPFIRDRWPEATLDIYYGWNFIDKILSTYGNLNMELFKSRLMQGIKDLGGPSAGIHFVGRVPPAELAKATYACNAWAFPTNFMETFCITAIQTQAAGLVPVVSDLAALKETVPDPSLRVAGWPMNTSYQTEFMNRIESVWSDAELRKQIRQRGRSFAMEFTYDNAYAKWNDLFSELGVRQLASVSTA